MEEPLFYCRNLCGQLTPAIRRVRPSDAIRIHYIIEQDGIDPAVAVNIRGEKLHRGGRADMVVTIGPQITRDKVEVAVPVYIGRNKAPPHAMHIRRTTG